MKHATPRKVTLSVPAIISGAALTLMVAACTTPPADDVQDTTQTTQTTQTTEADGAEGAADVTQATKKPTAVVKTAFPDLEAPTGEPELQSITDAHPTPGDVIHAAGPFDQRIVIQDLVFDGSTVSGKVLVTSDISELLALQVLAGFYDDQGNLLGTERFDYEPGTEHIHGGPSEPEAFDIAVPAEFADRAVSAAVGVPVLVNE